MFFPDTLEKKQLLLYKHLGEVKALWDLAPG